MFATPTVVSQPPAEVLRPLPIGAIVRLSDDTLAEVIWGNHQTVDVLHGYLRAAGIPGAGPWTFTRWQVEEATEAEQRSYHAAIAHALEASVTGILVPAWAPKAVRS